MALLGLISQVNFSRLPSSQYTVLSFSAGVLHLVVASHHCLGGAPVSLAMAREEVVAHIFPGSRAVTGKDCTTHGVLEFQEWITWVHYHRSMGGAAFSASAGVLAGHGPAFFAGVFEGFHHSIRREGGVRIEL